MWVTIETISKPKELKYTIKRGVLILDKEHGLTCYDKLDDIGYFELERLFINGKKLTEGKLYFRIFTDTGETAILEKIYKDGEVMPVETIIPWRHMFDDEFFEGKFIDSLEKSRGQLYVKKIENGVIFDHVRKGRWKQIIDVLDLEGGKELLIYASADSRKMGKKDIIKILNFYPTEKQLDLVGLLSPSTTVNIVKDYRITNKFEVELPKTIEDILKCPNERCITNAEREPFGYTHHRRFIVLDSRELRCDYCWREYPTDYLIPTYLIK